MDERITYRGTRLSSIRQINALRQEHKQALYRALIPVPLIARRCARAQSAPVVVGDLALEIRCPAGTASVELALWHSAEARDPVLYVHLADTAHAQLQVLLMCVNDPFAPRFDVDRDGQDRPTKLGTATRNLPAERAALAAGLAPGQVRRGLGLCRTLIPMMERLAADLGKERFLIEPLAYHNAVHFERYGFAYITGEGRMRDIDRGFQPGGALDARLDGATPFRQPSAGRTIRGRSWALHDGIRGEPWGGVWMVKRVGHSAHVDTCPDTPY